MLSLIGLDWLNHWFHLAYKLNQLNFSVTIMSLVILSPWQGANCSHDSDLVGDIKGILIAWECNVCFLLSSWGDEGVNFLDLNWVEIGAGLLDHFLIGFFVNNEYKSVAVFDGLNGRFTAQWVLDNSVLIESNDWLNSFQDVLWRSLLLEASWSLEGGSVPDLGFFGSMSSLLHGGLDFLCNLNSTI